jgi:ABC-type uncharacterized transport system substrate-binding protein
MKNHKIKISAIFILIILTIIACSKAEENESSLSNNEITAKEIGKYHNISLKRIEDRLQKLIDKQTSSRVLYSREYLDNIESDEIQNFVSETEPELGITEAEILDAVTITNNSVEATPDVASRNLIRINDTKTKLNDLVNDNKMTSSEKNLIFELLDLTYYCDSTGDYTNFQSKLDEIRTEKNSIQWTSDNGKMIDYGIEVGQNSYYYWLGDANMSGKQAKVLLVPLWVGLDVVGALAGGGSSMWSQRNNRSYDWAEIGGQSLIWGVAGSITGSGRFLRLFAH